MRPLEAQARGVAATLRGGHAAARALAIADSRSYVRSLFLASAVRLDLPAALENPASAAELAALKGWTRAERLSAWLDVGVAVRELGRRGDRYVLRGRRARALGRGDPLLAAHYRSLLDYQTGVYADLAGLLGDAPDAGRDDLEIYATVIADVSLAAAPFIAPYLRAVVAELAPTRVLDVGCGTGVYMRALLEADPELAVDGVDLAADVVARCDAALRAAGFAGRAQTVAGDVRTWAPPSGRRYGLVTLVNDVYYFPAPERPALYERLRTLLAPGGELLVVTMTPGGSIASAHLDLMLRCQTGAASLPSPAETANDLAAAGLTVTAQDSLVPTEPFVATRARLTGPQPARSDPS